MSEVVKFPKARIRHKQIGLYRTSCGAEALPELKVYQWANATCAACLKIGREQGEVENDKQA